MTMHSSMTHSPRQAAWPLPRRGTAAFVLKRAAGAPGRALGWLVACRRRAVERAELRSLDDYLVRDLGRDRVCAERHKPFWVE